MAAKFEPSELFDLAIVTAALSFFFSFRFPGRATFENWFGYFLAVLILVAVSIAVHEVAHHIMAKKYMLQSRSRIWAFGILFGFFILLLTKGALIFAALWTVTLTPIYSSRPGRKTDLPSLGEFAKVSAAGPLANIALAIIAKLLIGTYDFAPTLMTINLWIALVNMIPFFTPFIRPLLFGPARKLIAEPFAEGEFIFFGSRPLWIFIFTFSLITAISLYFLSAIASIAIALIAAAIAWVLLHLLIEPTTAPGGKEKGLGLRDFYKL